jgi:hypothetical protein
MRKQKRLLVSIYNNKNWYLNGELHRDNDQPAIIYLDGTMSWYRYGSYLRWVYIKDHCL